MRSIIFFIMCFFVSPVLTSQENTSEIVIGTRHRLQSSVLDQDRIIDVYTPAGYSASDKAYPVLYILDGQWYFLSGVAVQKALRTPNAIPEMIVVGIQNSNPLRRTLFDDENEKFTEFLEKELMGYIDANFRTTEERVIFGWEAAAYYISELIFKKPELFEGAIISDGGYAAEDLVKTFDSKQDVYLFIANSKKDIYYIGSTEAFYEVLKNNQPKNLIWTYELLNDEVHETLAHVAIYKGLKYYYHNYDSLVFESIQQFDDLGGMDYLHGYFEERAKRFGGDGSIDDSTKNALIWLAWNRDNFDYFTTFMTEFEDVLSTPRYASAYWQNRFGQFYLKHKDFKNAIVYFRNGLQTYPNSNFEEDMKTGLENAKKQQD